MLACQVPEVSAPTAVREDAVIVEFRLVPVRVPAGATTALPLAAVKRPFPFTVSEGIDVELPNVPVFEFTVASVRAALPGPEAAPSPVSAVR